MNYSEILKSMIDDSGMSLNQIAEALKEKGFSTDKGYISKLQNGRIPPAGDDLNRAIAEVVGGDGDSLIINAYIEKAPKEFTKFITPSLKNTKKRNSSPAGIKNYQKDPILHETLAEYPDSVFEYDDDEIMMATYQSYLLKAVNSVNANRKVKMNTVINAVLNGMDALNYRLSQVLFKKMTEKNMNEVWVIDYIESRSFEDKLMLDVKYILNLDISKEDFYPDLLKVIELRQELIYKETSAFFSREEAIKTVDTIRSTIFFIDC